MFRLKSWHEPFLVPPSVYKYIIFYFINDGPTLIYIYIYIYIKKFQCLSAIAFLKLNLYFCSCQIRVSAIHQKKEHVFATSSLQGDSNVLLGFTSRLSYANHIFCDKEIISFHYGSTKLISGTGERKNYGQRFSAASSLFR
jgi:hypothetical protein